MKQSAKNEQLWVTGYTHALAYYKKYGNLRVPVHYTDEDGFHLGLWIREKRKSYNSEKLSNERISALEKIGMIWKCESREYMYSWITGLKHAEDYLDKYGDLVVPASYTSEDGYHLGTWIANLRAAYKRGTISTTRIAKLDDMGMIWEKAILFNDGYSHAKNYYEKNGNLLIPNEYITDSGFPLGKWLENQRTYRFRNNSSYPMTKVAMLDEIGMVWSYRDRNHDIEWTNGISHAATYVKKHGNLHVKIKFVSDDGFKLGRWISLQRSLYKKGALKPSHSSELEELGMIWNEHDHYFEIGISHALDYLSQYGDLNVNNHYISPDGFKLGLWISNVRKHHKNAKLNNKRLDRLNKIGMIWDAREHRWEIGYYFASEYFERHGNLNIPYAEVTEGGFRLGSWLRSRKNDYKAGKLSKEHISALESIGIEW